MRGNGEPMKMKFRLAMLVCVLFSVAAAAVESNDSFAALTNATARVQMRLDQFSRSNANYELLLEAQKISASRNPRGHNASGLSPMDENCLRLQIKTLLALAKARDPNYDKNAETNRFYMNVVPPLTKGPGLFAAGMDPKAIQDPEARKAYEDAIAENNRRNQKRRTEMELSRGVDEALISIWVFAKHGLSPTPTAQKRAIEIFSESVTDKSLLERFNSSKMPGMVW